MAKKIINSYYTFDSTNNTITIDHFIKQEDLLLITDVTLGVILYNFADASKGATLTNDSTNETTTITLEFNASGAGATDTDKLQIIVDEPHNKFEPGESIIDPVHKMRVSNPENLIDTDFEYGLQSTKWETLELSNNVPSFYVGDGDGAIANLQKIESITGSDLITVTCSGTHGLSVGTPIDVQGLSSRTAEGKFLIRAISNETFTYQCNGIQTASGTISNIYTTVTPGTFYAGSQIPLEGDEGMISDQQQPSTLTVRTADVHGFKPGSRFYVVNSIGQKSIEITDTSSDTAPDGQPYVDYEETSSSIITPDLTQTVTTEFVSRWYHRFDAVNDVDLSTNAIYWPDHQLRTNDVLFYNASSGDAPVTGLATFTPYYVLKVNDNYIGLKTSYSGNTPISLSAGATGNYGKHSLHLAYEMEYGRKQYRNSYGYTYTRAYWFGNSAGSGWDMASGGNGVSDGGYLGLGNNATNNSQTKWFYVATRNNVYDYYITNYYARSHIGRWSSAFRNYGITEPNNVASRYNFFEDFTRWSSQAYETRNRQEASTDGGSIRYQGYFYHGTYSTYYNDLEVFAIPLIPDPEADSFYSSNHGLSNGDQISFTDSGTTWKHTGTNSYTNTTAPSSVGNGTYTAITISDNRFRLSGIRLHGFTNPSITMNAVIQKPTRNTFYLADHGFLDGQTINFTIGSGGAVPPSTSGVITPDVTTTSTSTSVKSFTIIDNWLKNQSPMKDSFVDMATYSGNNNYVFSNAGLTNSPINSYRHGYSSNYIYVNSAFGNAGGGYPTPNAADLSPTSPYDLLQGTSFSQGSRIMVMHGSDWSSNINIPYYLWTKEINLDPADNYIYDYYRSGFNGTSSTAYNPATSDRQSVVAPSGRTLYWSAQAVRVYNFGNYDFYLVRGLFRPNNWPHYGSPTTNDTGLSRTSNLNTYYYAYQNGYAKKSYVEFEFVFTILRSDSVTNSLDSDSELTNMVRDIALYFDSQYQYQPIANGQDYQIKLVNQNRFGVTKDGIDIDFTGHGTSPFVFTSESTLGIVDGSYTASATTERGFSLPLTFKAQGNSVVIDATVINDNQIHTTGHVFLDGTKVTYTSSGTSITGITSGNQYYVHVIDDLYVTVHNNYEDAINGTNPINVGAETSASHAFLTDSIVGSSEGVGTVDAQAESTILIGSDEALFKRYFKVGDTIIIKDNTTTPGSLIERKVAAIANDDKLTLDAPVGVDLTATKYFVITSIYARPDGFAVHRPFDGGVEIAAGTSPNSLITRQTRKYFRYQSGKGIQTSLAINFNPPVIMENVQSTGTTVKGRTRYPHRLSLGMDLRISGASDSTYNGTFEITNILNDFEFEYETLTTPATSIPGGIIQYNVAGYSDAFTRAGLFDPQNGFFFEYDGNTLNCVRRSSTTQLSGTVSCVNQSGVVRGTNTNFSGQLVPGDKIVIRGQTYKVIKIDNRQQMTIQPQFRGISCQGAIVTKTIDVKVPQADWNIDKCDGSGPEGFILNIDKIQMAYMDYSWYGAGKIRFGFKDTKGHVRYVHEFIHNNRLDEAYMRSGNIPAKYEVENGDNPSYAPTLFHWGTSVIMDGTFDDDKAYLFTAQSKALSFTNGQANTATSNGNSSLVSRWNNEIRRREWWVRVPFATTDASKFYTGLKVYSTANGTFDGEEIAFTNYDQSNFNIYIFIGDTAGYFEQPAVYPTHPSGEAMSLGQPASGGDSVELGTEIIPLVSLRLAPSVDSNLTGAVGQRDIINRMQLRLNEVGLILTHDCEVKLILNGDLDNVSWQNVTAPSLSQLIPHDSGDAISGGVEIFSFRASGGSTDNTGKRLSNTSDFKLSDIADMGNSILGGDGTFPNGPDVLTIAIKVIDTGDIGSDNPFKSSARITWAESQA